MVGPTNGAASTLAATPTSETWPLSPVTIGWVASWAARDTASASASHPGAHSATAARNVGATSRMPTHAATDREKPAERDSHGSSQHSTSTATDRLRRLLRPRPAPVAARAIVPMAAARSTEGSCPQTRTKPATPATAAPRTHQPRRPRVRTSGSRTASSSIRLAPETADRCVSPVAWNSSRMASSILDVSPTTSDGTSAAWSGGEWLTASRSPDRRSLATRCAGPGGCVTATTERTLSSAASRSATSVAASRTRSR